MLTWAACCRQQRLVLPILLSDPAVHVQELQTEKDLLNSKLRVAEDKATGYAVGLCCVTGAVQLCKS